MFERHVSKHDKVRVFECKVCSAKFSNLGNMYRHRSVHTGEKPFECDVCNAKFRTKPQLKVHRGRHDGTKPISELNSTCDVCGKRIRNSRMKKHLLEHVQIEEDKQNVI